MILRNGFSIYILLFVELSHSEARPQFRKIPYEDIGDRTPPDFYTSPSVEFITDPTFSAANATREKSQQIKIISRGANKRYVAEFADQDIIFPDAYQVVFDPSLRIEAPPKCAEGSTFCEDYPKYPSGQIRNVLKRKHIQNDFFGTDEAPESDKFNINNRIGEVDEFVCASYQRTIFPKVGKNKNNKWKYIINQEEQDGYIQGVRIETCQNPGAPCSLIGDLANGYTTSCKQKYIYRRLMSLTDNGDPVPETFQLPSACCCSYKRDLGILGRFGAAGVTPASAVASAVARVPTKQKFKG